MKWFKKLFFDEQNFNRELEDGFKRLQEKTLAENNALRMDLQQAKNELAVRQRVIDEQLSKLRDQNEADLFLICEKIKKEILDGKKKDEINSELQRMSMLQNQQRDLQNQLSPLGGGLGGLFR